MPLVQRRGFLLQSGLAAAGLAFWSPPLFSQPARKIKITEIEAHEILPPYHDYHAEWLFRYQGLHSRLRTVYIVKTDAGIEGYGENWGISLERLQGVPGHQSLRLDQRPSGTCP